MKRGKGHDPVRTLGAFKWAAVTVMEKKSMNCQWLTCAHSYASVDGGSEVTVEAFVWVAEVSLGAELPHLLGTHPAAAAAIQHQAHSRGALRRGGGARALVAALLTRSLSTGHTQTHARLNICQSEWHSTWRTQCLLRLELMSCPNQSEDLKLFCPYI